MPSVKGKKSAFRRSHMEMLIHILREGLANKKTSSALKARFRRYLKLALSLQRTRRNMTVQDIINISQEKQQ